MTQRNVTSADVLDEVRELHSDIVCEVRATRDETKATMESLKGFQSAVEFCAAMGGDYGPLICSAGFIAGGRVFYTLVNNEWQQNFDFDHLCHVVDTVRAKGYYRIQDAGKYANGEEFATEQRDDAHAKSYPVWRHENGKRTLVDVNGNEVKRGNFFTVLAEEAIREACQELLK